MQEELKGKAVAEIPPPVVKQEVYQHKIVASKNIQRTTAMLITREHCYD